VARGTIRNTAASVHQRLLNRAKAVGADPNLILIWYGLERLLYRLSVSPHRDRFVLKGAMLFRLWTGPEFRPTKDLDLLGFVRKETGTLRDAFTAICEATVEDDGLVFEAKTIRIAEIREQQEYGGLRVSITAKLGNARVPMQIDVGFGDAITPAATREDFPSLLDHPRPRILAYPRETVVAEKYEAIAQRGMTNSRMKDYYDLWFLSQRFEFDGRSLADAIAATFSRRGTALPVNVPSGLTEAYASDSSHARQWLAFVSRISTIAPEDLVGVVTAVRRFVLPPSTAAARAAIFEKRWQSGVWIETKAPG
jgi:predicted nucleotidyltransferase component of viral defense system